METAYRLMWMIVMFDLPVMTKSQRDAATKFRRYLLDEAFEMAQYSVYLRFCTSYSQFKAISNRVMQEVPEEGKVDILQMTDKQYERIISYFAQKRTRRKQAPTQFQLF